MAYVKLYLAVWLLAVEFIYCDDYCGEGEQWIYGYYPEATCDNVYPEVDLSTGTEGCFCLEDYVRDSNGKCIPVSSCPEHCYSEPEISYYPEHNNTDPEVSPDPEFEQLEPESSSPREFEDSEPETSFYPEHDDTEPEVTSDPELGQLEPDSSSLREFEDPEHDALEPDGIENHHDDEIHSELVNENISPEQDCCGINEYYGTGLFPERTCDEPNPLIQIELVGCYCNHGYIRNEYGVCIPESESKLNYILHMMKKDEDDRDELEEFPINSSESIRDEHE